MRAAGFVLFVMTVAAAAQTGDVRVQRAIRVLEARGLLSQTIDQYRDDPGRVASLGELLKAAADIVEITPADPSERIRNLNARVARLDSAVGAVPESARSAASASMGAFYDTLLRGTLDALKERLVRLRNRTDSLADEIRQLDSMLRQPVMVCVYGGAEATGHELRSADVAIGGETCPAWTTLTLLTGEYQAQVSAAGYGDTAVTLAVTRRPSLDSCIVVFAGMCTRVTVLWHADSGQVGPATGVKVWAERLADGTMCFVGTTDQYGGIETRALTPGDYVFWYQAPGADREHAPNSHHLAGPIAAVRLSCARPGR